MRSAIKWGVILGVVVGLTGFVFAGVGFHTNPSMAMVFVGIAITFNVAAVIMALRETRDTTSWAGQLVNGIVIGVVGAVIIFASSWTMTSIVFPDYYEQMLAGLAASLASSGLPPGQVEAQLDAVQAGATPVASALQGAIGTVITSIVVAAIAGLFMRKPAS